MIQAPYELAEVLSIAVGIILNYLNSKDKERLFSDAYARGKETIKAGASINRDHHAIIGYFSAAGFRVGNDGCHIPPYSERIGVGVQRNFY